MLIREIIENFPEEKYRNYANTGDLIRAGVISEGKSAMSKFEFIALQVVELFNSRNEILRERENLVDSMPFYVLKSVIMEAHNRPKFKGEIL